jgi:histidine ammonia-lyase
MHSLLDFSKPITIEEIITIAGSREKIVIGSDTILVIESSRKYLDKKSSASIEPIYGVNTGFGSLCNTVISSGELSTLQENLLRSHACGTGAEVPQSIVRLMLLLKVRGLAYGYSGVSLETVQRLVDFINLDIIPVIYQQGSLGASGDLAPLAHLALPRLALPAPPLLRSLR